jgi:hypothetical protein
MKLSRLIILPLLVLSSAGAAPQNAPAPTAEIWTRYLAADDKASVLPDFSIAGYRGGQTGIPDSFPALKTFNIVDYGAVANDQKSDQEAIEAAIRAAEAAGGGVVFFPPGVFWVNTDPINTRGIEINGSHIVLKGSGTGPGGTVVFMVNHMLKNDPIIKWGNKPMFTFKHKDADYFTSNLSARSFKITTSLVGSVTRGAQALEVSDVRGFAAGDLIVAYAESNRTELVSECLHGKTPHPSWARLVKQGVTFQEMTRVLEVKPAAGANSDQAQPGTLVIVTPCTVAMSSQDKWRVGVVPSLRECGFEDIHFKGNFQDFFVHHKDYIHDGGWQGVKMVGTVDSWVRRCVFTDVNGGAALEGTMNCSILLSAMAGNRGHTCFNMTFGSYNLVGCNVAREDRGGITGAHGVGTSHLAHNNVTWRFKTKVRGIDFHGTFPRNTLSDLYESDDVSRHGGNYTDLPNHMGGMVIWNFKQTGDAVVDYDFWKMATVTKGNYEYVKSVTIVDPVVVGFHGANTTIKADALAHQESAGQAVLPESLYEAQLTQRYGQLPAWVTQVKAEWEKLSCE